MNDLIPVIATSPQGQRLIDDMTMRRFTHETQRNYLRDVGRFATWLGRSPERATAEGIRRFQIEQLRHVFEMTVQRCMAEELVGGEGFAGDASIIIRPDLHR